MHILTYHKITKARIFIHSVFQRHITHKPHTCDCINMSCHRYNYIPVSTGAVGSVLYLSTVYSASVRAITSCGWSFMKSTVIAMDLKHRRC